KPRTAGLWGLQTPEEYGGANLTSVLNALIAMELGRSLVSFNFGGSADNILFAGTDEQKQRYLVPTIEGQRHSCFALSEPNTGSDATNIQARAVQDGGDWVIDGQKTWISNAHQADYAIVFAVTDPGQTRKRWYQRVSGRSRHGLDRAAHRTHEQLGSLGHVVR